MTSGRHRDASGTERAIVVVLVTLGIIVSALRFDADAVPAGLYEALGILGMVMDQVTVDAR